LTFNEIRYTVPTVIQSFHCKDTQAMFEGICPRRWLSIRAVAERKLQMVNRATVLNDLKSPPGNHLEALKDDRKGQHSIRINKQWRVCFVWAVSGPAHVEIVDYH
jgi:proteic killer suppression protein